MFRKSIHTCEYSWPNSGANADPRAPGGRVGGMRRRGEGEDVEDHPLVVADPVRVDESILGMPAHAHGGRPSLGPFPIDAEVDRIGERANLLLSRVAAVVVALREQDAGEQERGVDRGQLDRLEAAAGLHVEEMIEEAAIAGGVRAGRVLRGGPEELQRFECAVGGLGASDPAVFYADGVRRQREPDGGDARERRRGPAVGGQAVAGRRQVPEEVEGFVLQRIEECGRVGCDARAPGVTGTASEGQGKNDGIETAAPSGQNVYSAPTCRRLGSLTTQFGVVPPFMHPKF